ncbi:unnamed protein product, partial [Rhizoctonia solani]
VTLFDRIELTSRSSQCLKWRSDSDGGFKRFMTFSYTLSVPLIVTYSVAMAVMKYQAGYIAFLNPASTPSHPLPPIVVPAPTSSWPEAHQKLVFPLYVLFAVAWALEMVSHLEELCFWLFMIKEQEDSGHGGIRPWFKSFEYKLWCCGSLMAVVLLPLVTLETRHDLQQLESWTFFAGSVGSLIITIWFFKVLWKFPSFLKRIQDENAESEVIVRLVAFQDLNRIRIIFRLMFVVPLLILACDGLKSNGPHTVSKTAGAVDILPMVAGIGCIVSSVITLLIFFPRSIAREQGYATRTRTRSQSAMQSESAPKSLVSRPRLTIQSRQSRSQRTTVGEIQVEPLQRPSPSAAPLSPVGVYVSVRTSVRGDSSYFRPNDESLPTYMGDGLGDSRRNLNAPDDDDYFAASGSSLIRPGSVATSAVPLVERKGLHPLLCNYTSPIALLEQDDAIGRAL